MFESGHQQSFDLCAQQTYNFYNENYFLYFYMLIQINAQKIVKLNLENRIIYVKKYVNTKYIF